MKIYTRKGDDGTTGLFGGDRVSKADARVEAYGSVDELCSALGVARAAGLPAEIDELLSTLQSELFDIGAELACAPGKEHNLGARVDEEQVGRLEHAIDRFEEELTPLTAFILPGGTPGASQLHLARTICRRAERRIVALPEAASPRHEIGRYLNRLSDLLFVLARAANAREGVGDVKWRGRR